jgi:hypothetical protein
MVPYVVRSGDHLLKIALKMGFDANAVWQDPKNAALRALRPSMHVLCVGDVLYVPKQLPPQWMPLKVGSRNPFHAKVPTVKIALKVVLEGKPLASEKCKLQELPDLGDLTTTSDGTLRLEVPVATEAVTVEFTSVDLILPLRIGHLDPVSEPTGVYQRLTNLGCVFGEPGDIGTPDAQSLREPLAEFQLEAGTKDATGDLNDDARSKLKSAYGC